MLAGAHSLAAKDNCCPDDNSGSLSACGQACSITNNEYNVVSPTTDGDCCSDCAPECLSARGQVDPVGIQPTSENKDNVITPTVNARASINCRLSRMSPTYPYAKQAAVPVDVAKVIPTSHIWGLLERQSRVPHPFQTTPIPVPVERWVEMLDVVRKLLSDASSRSHVAA
jgi:hypothetical protein